MEERTAKLVTFGRGGDTVEYSRWEHGSGYGSPENPHAADPTSHEIPDGCPVIDMRPAVDAGPGVAMAISGPMVNVDLEPGEVDALCDTTPNLMAATMKAEPGNAFGALLVNQEFARAQGRKYGPLDSVDLETYISLWREAGARIGTVQGGEFIWEE